MAEVYHFAQPNVAAPKKIQIIPPAGEEKLSGFQAVAWNTPLVGIISKKNHCEAIVDKTKSVEHSTVQFQQWWGEKNAIKVWDGTKYGYDVNKVKASFGCMVSVPENTGSAIGYATFYLRGYQENPRIRYWLQYSLFDERGVSSPIFKAGEQYTDDLTMECQIGNNQYGSLNIDSNPLSKSPFSNLKFFGGKISRQQLWNIMVEFKKINSGILLEPNQHKIFAFGVNPELGDEKKDKPQSGRIKMIAENLFLRTEY